MNIIHINETLKILWTFKHSPIFKKIAKCVQKYIITFCTPKLYVMATCEEFMTIFIRNIYNESKMNGIIYNNKTYENKHDDSYENFDELGAIYEDSIYCDNREQIYDIDILVGTELYDGENPKIKDDLDKICEFLEKNGPMNIIIKNNLVMKNFNGINGDNRGNNYCLVRPVFLDTISLNEPTLTEFTNALWLLKSHKFDLWYELFCNVDITNDLEIIYIDLNYDHGS